MKEIAPKIYFETAYEGVTLGAVSLSHGLILIDTPYKSEDIRSWRSSLLNLGGGVVRLLINLDAHEDRTLGAKGMECTVVSHERVNEIFNNRSSTFKPQNNETGAEWEESGNLGTIRWAPPEITFSDQMQVHWDDYPVTLEYHPGPSTGSTWVKFPEQKIIFLGDAVPVNQPPFFENSDIPTWIETLQDLQKKEYLEYIFVSGRGGIIVQEQINQFLKFLKKTNRSLESNAKKKLPAEKTIPIAHKLINEFSFPNKYNKMYSNRLKWGLFQYYAKNFIPPADESFLL